MSDDKPRKKSDFNKADNFQTFYANNSYLESSNWDLKITFGELDQSLSEGGNSVVQKAAITLPWPQVKALWYFMGLHLLGHEKDFGRIVIPAGIIPPFPAHKPENVEAEQWREAEQYYRAFLAKNPEILPKKEKK